MSLSLAGRLSGVESDESCTSHAVPDISLHTDLGGDIRAAATAKYPNGAGRVRACARVLRGWEGQTCRARVAWLPALLSSVWWLVTKS